MDVRELDVCESREHQAGSWAVSTLVIPRRSLASRTAAERLIAAERAG